MSDNITEIAAVDFESEIAAGRERIEALNGEKEAVYAELGRKVIEETPEEEYQQEKAALAELDAAIAAAEDKIGSLMKEKEEKEKAEKEALEKRTCKNCGTVNPEGTTFCQECGKRLAKEDNPLVCRNCGTENFPGTKFCRECGTKLPIVETPVPAVPEKIFCSTCGAENRGSNLFCGECGARL